MLNLLLNRLWVCFCIVFMVFGPAVHGQSQKPLHVLLLDACLLPDDFDFLRGKHLNIEFITSAKPFLKTFFNPEMCLKRYRKAVGGEGQIVSFHSEFMGDSMADVAKVNAVIDRIKVKRGPVDFVLANNSDQAAYIAHFIRQRLGQETPWLDVPCPENFYDKYVMKTNLRKNQPSVRTADFIGFDAREDAMERFFNQVNFPSEAVIFKKRRSAGSVGIKVLKSMKDYHVMRRHIRDPENYLIEKFIHGRVFRVAGEKIDGKVKFAIPSLNLTTPYDHYKLAKPRTTTFIDETVVASKDFRGFAERTLDGLEMESGTFHLEGILSDQDHELYFMEIALRVGEGNMDAPHREVFGYHAKRAYFFKQFPKDYFSVEDEQKYLEELFEQPTDAPEQAFTVVTFPFLDANKHTFQRIRTNLSLNLRHGDEEIPSLVACDFEESFEKMDMQKLAGKQGVLVGRYAYQACLKAVACRFEGSRAQIEKDLGLFQKKYFFEARPALKILNLFVPRHLLVAGGL